MKTKANLRPLPVPNATPGAVSVVIDSFASRHGLSAREAAVLAAAALGLDRRDTAYRLGCRIGTVDTYWRRVFKKTRMSCQSELFARLLSFAVQTKVESP